MRMIFGAASLAFAGAASAAPNAAAEARYQQDRQACVTGNTQQARDVCLREAGAARDASQAGALQKKPGTDISSNAVQRCKVFKGADEHAECLARLEEPSSTQGSALKGGLLRESVTTTTVQPK